MKVIFCRMLSSDRGINVDAFVLCSLPCVLLWITVERERDARRHKRLNLKMDDEDDEEDEGDEEYEDIDGDELDAFEDEMEDEEDSDDDEEADNESDNEDDEEDEDDDYDRLTSKNDKSDKEYIKRLEAQERIIREKLQKQAPEDMDMDVSDDGDDDEEGDDVDRRATNKDDNRGTFWGKSKRAYYDADNVEYELTDDDEDQVAEEKEARKIQRQIASELQFSDYGIADANGNREGSRRAKSKKTTNTEKSSKLKVDIDDRKELKILLKEMTKSLEEVRTQVAPLLDYIKKKKKSTTDGMSYLDAKYLLLMSYCSHIAFYLLLKAEGRSVRDHPVMEKLIEIRTYLERTKPIDKRMKFQIEKLLDAASRDAEKVDNDENGLQLRPRPDALVRQDDDSDQLEDDEATNTNYEQETENGVYRPPRIAPTTMDGEGDLREIGRQKRAAEASRKKIASSEYLRSVVAEMSGAPEEVQNIGTVDTSTRREISDAKKLLSARLEAEEEAFVRLPVSTIEKKKMKAAERALGVGATLADFADDLDAIAELGGRNDSYGRLSGMNNRRIGDVIQDAVREEGVPGRKVLSGDAELPVSESLNERRLKYNSRKIANRAIAEREAAEREAMISKNAEPDHPEYSKALIAAEKKKSMRAARNSTEGQMTRAPVRESFVDGKRKISTTIEKNRGLTPHRKKLTKNPRKKHRIAYESAITRQKGQVQQVASQIGPYSGEATGVRTKLSKSRKL